MLRRHAPPLSGKSLEHEGRDPFRQAAIKGKFANDLQTINDAQDVAPSFRRGCYRDPTSASKPEITSKSSSSMPLWRNWWKERWSCSSRSLMFLSARSIAARRLAFSLARDSAQARESEMKRYSRISARNVAVPLPITSGKFPVGQRSLA